MEKNNKINKQDIINAIKKIEKLEDENCKKYCELNPNNNADRNRDNAIIHDTITQILYVINDIK